MGVVAKVLRSTAVAMAGSVIVWKALLDERAHDSVRKAWRVTSDLSLYLLRDYMEPTSQYASEQAANENREWIAHQWENISY